MCRVHEKREFTSPSRNTREAVGKCFVSCRLLKSVCDIEINTVLKTYKRDCAGPCRCGIFYPGGWEARPTVPDVPSRTAVPHAGCRVSKWIPVFTDSEKWSDFYKEMVLSVSGSLHSRFSRGHDPILCFLKHVYRHGWGACTQFVPTPSG